MRRYPATYLWYVVTMSLLAPLAICYIFRNFIRPIPGLFDGIALLTLPVFMPLFLVELLELVAMGAFVVAIALQAKKWALWAIITAACITPITSILTLTQLANVLHRPINNPGNPAIFYILATFVVVSGVVAYNDIKYRRPHRPSY